MTHAKQTIGFRDQVVLRCPEALVDALAQAADKNLTNISNYVRGAVARQLQHDGIEIQMGAVRCVSI